MAAGADRLGAPLGEDRFGHACRRLAAGSRLRQARALPTRSPPRPRSRRRPSISITARSRFVAVARWLRNSIDSEGPATATRYAPLPTRARARRDDRSSPSGASRSGAAAPPPELAELPERLAGAGATPSVQAVRHRLRDALSVDAGFRQAGGEAVRFAFERQDPGTPVDPGETARSPSVIYSTAFTGRR